MVTEVKPTDAPRDFKADAFSQLLALTPADRARATREILFVGDHPRDLFGDMFVEWPRLPTPVPARLPGAELLLNLSMSPRTLQAGKAAFRPTLLRHGPSEACYFYATQGPSSDDTVDQLITGNLLGDGAIIDNP